MYSLVRPVKNKLRLSKSHFDDLLVFFYIEYKGNTDGNIAYSVMLFTFFSNLSSPKIMKKKFTKSTQNVR